MKKELLKEELNRVVDYIMSPDLTTEAQDKIVSESVENYNKLRPKY